jgi:hypothetical protein
MVQLQPSVNSETPDRTLPALRVSTPWRAWVENQAHTRTARFQLHHPPAVKKNPSGQAGGPMGETYPMLGSLASTKPTHLPALKRTSPCYVKYSFTQ